MVKNKTIRAITFIAITVSSLLLILSSLSGLIDPQWLILPALAGLAFPYLFLLHVVTIAGYAIIIRNKTTLFFLIPFFTSIYVLPDFWGFNYFIKSSDKNTSIRLLTYNVHRFKKGIYYDDNILPDVLNTVRKVDPDIACFQDFYYSKKRNFPTVDSIKQVLKTNFVYRGPRKKKFFRGSDLAIFSKYPIVDSGYILLTDEERGRFCIWVDIKKEDEVFRVYNLHLASFNFETEDYERWENRSPPKKVAFLARKVDQLENAFRERARQVHIIKDSLDGYLGPKIIMGDFNDTPASYTFRQLCKGMNNTFRHAAKGYGVTFNGDLPNYQIDYILTSPVFNIYQYKIIKSEASDHFPVVAEVEIED